MKNLRTTDLNAESIDKAAPNKIGKDGLLSLRRIFEANSLYFLCTTLFIISIILFNKYIWGGRLLLWMDIGSDSINFDWPQRYYYSKYLHLEGIPRWSFAQGLGANVFPASMGDAGNLLLYMFPPADIVYVLAYVEMAKLFFAGVLFFLFLKKINVTDYVALIGATLFAFCGFMTMGTVYAYFATEGLYLAFLLYSIELLRQNNNYFCFPVAIALVAAYNPLLLYMFGLLLTAYLLFSLFSNGYTRQWPVFMGKTILLGALGLGIAAFFLLGNIYLMLESPRGSGNVSLARTLSSLPAFRLGDREFYVTFLLRMLGNDMSGYAIGTLDRYNGYQHYLSAPGQYCGLISLLVIPQLFALGSRKLKWIATVVFMTAALPVIFPYFRYAFWLFSGDYFRTFSLVFSVVQILFAIKALDLIIRNKKVNTWLLFVTWAGLSLLVMILSRYSHSTAIVHLRYPVIAFLLAETILIWFITWPRFLKWGVIVLPAVIFAEIVFSSWGTYNYRNIKSKSDLERRTGYNDSTVEVVKLLHKTDPGFYRIEKNYGSGYGGVYKKISWLIPRSYNDSQMQDYYSSPSYFSFNNKYYVRFLQKMSLIRDSSDETETRWINGLGQAPLMQILASNKYLLYKQPYFAVDHNIYDSVAQIGNIGLFRNRYFLPLGFTYNTCISESELNKTGNRKQIMLLKAACADNKILESELKDFNQLTVADTMGIDTAGILTALYTERKSDTMQITSFSQSHITGNIDVSNKKIMFFSIPYDKGWKAMIDGRQVETMILNYGFWGCILKQGHHNVELTYLPPVYTIGLRISEISILLLLALTAAVFINKRIRI